MGEAVVVLNPELASSMPWFRKQGMQLASKMRYIAAQFNAYLQDELWRSNALHANSMASYLAAEASKLPGVEIAYQVQANEVFATIPEQAVKSLAPKWKFYLWEEDSNMVRWVTSWDTRQEMIDEFPNDLRQICG